jgi:hypothetical protein
VTVPPSAAAIRQALRKVKDSFRQMYQERAAADASRTAAAAAAAAAVGGGGGGSAGVASDESAEGLSNADAATGGVLGAQGLNANYGVQNDGMPSDEVPLNSDMSLDDVSNATADGAMVAHTAPDEISNADIADGVLNTVPATTNVAAGDGVGGDVGVASSAPNTRATVFVFRGEPPSTAASRNETANRLLRSALRDVLHMRRTNLCSAFKRVTSPFVLQRPIRSGSGGGVIRERQHIDVDNLPPELLRNDTYATYFDVDSQTEFIDIDIDEESAAKRSRHERDKSAG